MPGVHPQFTFREGNTAGLRRLPRYLLGMIATFVVPRSRRLWVFGCGIGPGEGALPLLRLAAERFGAGVRLVWLTTSAVEHERALALGLDAVPKETGRGFWLTLRARVAVVTHGLGDVNRYAVRGAFVVQLWHGVPLKRLHLDAPVAQASRLPFGRRLIRAGYRAVGRQIDLFPVAGAPVAARVTSAFGVAADAVAVTGDPRDDVLLRGEQAQRRGTARELLAAAVGTLPGGPVVLYAPTWRDGDVDPAAPTAAQWRAIGAWLERVDGVLVVRSHPLGQADYGAGPRTSPRIRTLDAGTLPDLTPALPAVDHLVTDYSSTAFDFALTGGTMVFLAADIATYLDSRGLYEPYRAFSGGRHVTTWEHALAQLDALVHGDTAAADAHTARLRDEHFDFLDGRATERVLAEITRRVDGGGSPARPAPAHPARPRPTVSAVHVHPDHLEVTFAEPADRFADDIALDGPRRLVPGEMAGHTARIPLLVSRWGATGLALPSGRYRLRVGGSHRVTVPGPLPAPVVHELFRATVTADDGGLTLRVAAPLRDDELGARNQRRLRLDSVRPRRRLEDAVYFESFYSRTSGDNPAGIDRVLARRRPDVRRYWSVTDRSVPVPDGAVPLVEYSRAWWRVRAEARVYVINDWLRWTFRPRRGQHVLQTWHGTMLKRLALDRPEHTPRQRFAAVRQGRRWNAMIAQNDYSARIFRSCYAFRGPIWQSGYPRNDVFADPDRAQTVRELIGLPDGAQAVLYAPTWRDDRTELVDYLDLVEFSDALPDGHVLLVRGHSRTLGHGRDLRGARLIDVTSYPDVADLMLVADLLVTDYSSVMFDFAATGKPMIFYTPDLEHYGDALRGFYFDLLADAPGPVVETRDDLLAQIAGLDRTVYAQRYAAWQAKFAPYDDGHAGERVVARMLDEGWLG